MEYYAEYDSPVGRILLTSDGENLTGLWMNRGAPAGAVRGETLPVLVQTRGWLDGYFRCENPAPDIPLKPEGTDFQKKVWQLLLGIGCGQTRTYGDIAREMAQRLGKEKMSAQAIGQAVGKNPISIIIPCHRCVGARGQLTGYAGGVEKKVWLLRHEGLRIEEERVL